jgi:hypothetical protein
MSDLPLTSFSRALEWHQSEPSVATGSVTADWAQGRATFGGLVGAIALRQTARHGDGARPLRAFTVTFAAPLLHGAEARCTSTVLREGKDVTLVEARIEQAAAVCCVATAAYGGARESAVAVAPRQPPEMVPLPEAMQLPYLEGLMPAFLRHVRLYWALGNPPFSAAPIVPIGGYCELLDAGARPDACMALALLDAWPSPTFSALSSPARSSTLSWSVDFFTDLSAHEHPGPFVYEARVVGARGGYVQEESWLWDARGVTLARAEQVVALFA